MKFITRIIFCLLILIDVSILIILFVPMVLVWWPIVIIRWLFIGGDPFDLMFYPQEWIMELPYKIIPEENL